ncbi:MAG: hypothetical protein AAF889_03200 [Cyanobacteria bacterium P01_D01_bin.73]
MSYRHHTAKILAPCIVDRGIVVNQQDMQKLLSGLGRVSYSYSQDGVVASEGEGVVVEVFADDVQATLVANAALYINVCSFDYLKIEREADDHSSFSLMQDNRVLKLSPKTNWLQDSQNDDIDEAALEAVFDRVLLANFDANTDDESHRSDH